MSSDDTQRRDSRSVSGLLALIVCGLLVAGLMPLVLARVEVVEKREPQVQRVSSPLVVELLDPPGPPTSAPKLPAPNTRPAKTDDATGQTAKLVERRRAIDAQPKKVVNPLREPDSQPSPKAKRPRAAELLLDEFP